ncbi:MAG: DASS family sodium-coupled anion symporter [Bdellovibrionales bacterium]|nr:DASS family sodium-coupled anion symporter [Bdellovibrionales bacterium]
MLINKNNLYASLSILLSLFFYFSILDHLPNSQKAAISTLVLAICFWVLEIVPLYVTGFIASFLLMLSGEFSGQDIFYPYFDPVIVLFLGGFVLALGMQNQSLDKRMANFIIHRSGSKPSHFLLVLMLVTAFLSMWMSNTAATAIMIPIALSLLKQSGYDASKDNFCKLTVLAVAYSATLGGIGTLIGSPPNAIAAKYMLDAGMELSFIDWILKSLPFVALALIVTWRILLYKAKDLKEAIELNPEQYSTFTKEQKVVIIVFVLTVALWLTTKLTGFSSSMIALLPVILFSFTGIINETDIQKISWSTLLLFGGGLSLGSAMIQSGADKTIVNASIEFWHNLPLLAFNIALVFFSVLVTMIASNTASAAILIPMLLPLTSQLPVSSFNLVYLIAVGVSLDFMMPMGTPPSAIAYSTGIVRVKEMVKIGFIINLTTGLLLSLYVYLF